MSRFIPSRRSFVRGSLATAAFVAGGALRPRFLTAGNASSISIRVPPVLTGAVLEAAPGTFEFRPGTQSAVYALNGSYLGPTVVLNRGDRFQVEMLNRLPDEELILHWHGILAPEEMDGHPRYQVASGESYLYDFTVNQRAGTYWYHSHTDMMTAPQTYKGLAGLFIVHDEEERSLGLPADDYDIPLVLQDKRLDDAHQLIYAPTPVDHLNGWQGDTVLVNGTPEAVLGVAPTLYRFRLLNASNARVFRVALSGDRPFHLIANDGGLLSAPIETSSIMLPPGARAEILVDFAGLPPGTTILMKSLEFDSDGVVGSRQGQPLDLMRFEVDREGNSGGVIPGSLSTLEPLDPADALRTRTFRLHQDHGMHMINGFAFDMETVPFDVPLGDLEIWEFFNPSLYYHPMHVHGVQFQVVDRNGSEDVPPEDRGWKDTVLVKPYERVRVLLRFTAHAGIYLLHCHNLEHEDHGMMMNFRITGPTDVASGREEHRSLRALPNRTSGETSLLFPRASFERRGFLVDDLGRRVREHIVPSGVDRLHLDLSHLSSGRYRFLLGNESVAIVLVR